MLGDLFPLLALCASLCSCGPGLFPLGTGATGGGSTLGHGVLDATFQVNGVFTFNSGVVAPYGVLNAVNFTVSEKGFLLAYSVTDTIGFETDLAIKKFLPDGSVDSSFGVNGFATASTQVGFANEFASKPLFLSNGKILLTGFESGVLLLFARLNSDGSSDTTFDTDGAYIQNIGGSSWTGGPAAEDPEGRILTVGSLDSDALITRILADGGNDTSFDGDGVVATNIGGSGMETYRALAFQTDGKIVAVGLEGTGAASDILVSRYTSNGALDPTFATSGVLTLDFAGQSDTGSVALVLSDGKILVGGTKTSASGTDTDFVVLRLLTDGQFDSTFSADGIASYDFGFTSESLTAIALQSDGNFVVAGITSTRTSLFVVKTDGSIDSGFGTDGLARSTQTSLRAMALDSQGKILTVSGLGTSPVLMRHLP